MSNDPVIGCDETQELTPEMVESVERFCLETAAPFRFSVNGPIFVNLRVGFESPATEEQKGAGQ